MSFAVVWEPVAINLATGFLADDPNGVRGLFEAVDALVEEPRPPHAFPFGTSGLHRLRVGRYCVVYETDDATRTIKIRHVGRRAWSSEEPYRSAASPPPPGPTGSHSGTSGAPAEL